MKNASLILFLAFSGAALPALAGHGGQDDAHQHAAHAAAAKPSVPPAFAALDKDKDRFLSKAEMAKHPMAGHFAMMDANKDGKLSPKEFGSM